MAHVNLNELAQALRQRGLTVRIDPGAQGRGSSSLNVRCCLIHDDIIGGCPRLPRVIASGIQQPTQYVPGPLYNIWIECDGTVILVASGVSNNAGAGGFRGIYGNSGTFSICRSHHPDVAQATPAQNRSAAITAAVVAERERIPTSHVIGHKEWTTRKADPWNVAMGSFRDEVQDHRVRPMSAGERKKIIALAKKEARGRRMLRPRRVPRQRGRDVMEAQYALGIKPTKTYGHNTVKHVKQLQAWLDIDVKRPGRVNRATWEALLFFYYARAWGYVA